MRRRVPEQKAKLQKLSPEAVTATELAGEPIVARLTKAPGNGAAIGGLKVMRRTAGLRRGLRARRTSTRSMPRASTAIAHLERIVHEAQQIVNDSL